VGERGRKMVNSSINKALEFEMSKGGREVVYRWIERVTSSSSQRKRFQFWG
jgi:hypothetical protein